MRGNPRRGAASVECAVCLPLLILVVLGAIEACSIVFLQQSLQLTAYETARIAASPFHDAQDAAKAGRAMMDQRELQGSSIKIKSSALPGYADIKLVTATVSVPVAPNRVVPAWVIRAATLSSECTMVKEVKQ